MRRTFVAIGSAVLAAVITTVAAWTFLVPFSVREGFITVVYCLCMPPHWLPADNQRLMEANGWFAIGDRRFHLYAPAGSQFWPDSGLSGRIVTPRFVLRYVYGARGLPQGGRDVVDEPIRVDAMPAILSRMTLPGASEAYYAALYVPPSVGRPVPLLIFGTFRSSTDRAIADAILATVSFRPFESGPELVQPAPVKVEPPVFDIAGDPA